MIFQYSPIMCRIIAVNLPLAPRLRGRFFKGRKNNLSFASPSIRCPTTYGQALRRIIIPEAFEVALPTLGNSLISIIKGTSLAFTCAVVEITAQGKIIGGRTYRYFEVYVSLAIIYWVITIIIEQLIKFIEKRIRIPEQVAMVSPARIKECIYDKD